jgi:hypothetical protein
MEDSRKSREHGMSLLLHRRKIATDAAKSGDPSRTANGCGGYLDHPFLNNDTQQENNQAL